VIESNGVHCQANICNPNDSNKQVQITKQGDQDINNTVNKLVKKSVWKIMGIGGYEFVNQGMMLGVSGIDYKGLLGGVDVVSDFKSTSNSGVGLFVGYRPELGKLNDWKINLVVGAGPIAHFNNFSDIGAQAFVGFTFLEQDK
jgi:hypothetical protein